MGFNIVSWFLIALYVVTIFIISLAANSHLTEGFISSLPCILMAIFLSERALPLLNLKYKHLTKRQVFFIDLSIVSISFLSAQLIYILTDFNNPDVKGWWSLWLNALFIFEFLYAVIYSALALMLPHHKYYTFIFSGTILIVFSLSKYWPRIDLAGMEALYVFLFSLIFFHLFICFYYLSKIKINLRKSLE